MDADDNEEMDFSSDIPKVISEMRQIKNASILI
jgi:hypothetical protein